MLFISAPTTCVVNTRLVFGLTQSCATPNVVATPPCSFFFPAVKALDVGPTYSRGAQLTLGNLLLL